MSANTPTSKPRVRVREATPADVDQIIDVHFAAFANDSFNQLMYPNGVSADARAKFAASFFPPETPDTAAAAIKKGESLVMVAELFPDGNGGHSSGEIVGFARWVLQREQRTEEEWNVVQPPPTEEMLGKGVDVDVYNAFIGELHNWRRKSAKGDPALFLGLIACKPSRQRIGAGTALLSWGAQLADKLGLPTFLEASPVGYGVYRKFGYEDIGVVDFAITERWGVVRSEGMYWGANNAVEIAGIAPEGIMRSVIMRRAPKPAAASVETA
ncbi:N-acetyltransferase-like protein [Podospora didyma]|uniref:N-acetyltransferase-like protein n=1 Tax=Podospora didyma TaxID=330526 RepID=A0AAE0U7C0_9PEZI|nr:N-acetyltransferase-like protein [Podospora didyma]